MRSSAARRYDSAGSLARDVERYLKDEPIEARPPSAWYRFQKLARRHKVALFTASLVVAALVLGTVVSTWQAFRATVAERVAENRKLEADEARNLAEQRRDELAAVNDNLRRANYVADMNLARVAWDENNLSRAHELLEKHRPRLGEADPRGFEWHYLRRLFRRDLLTIKAHVGTVGTVAFTPDGKRLVTSGLSQPRQKYSNPRSGEVKFWDAETGQPLRVPLIGPADNLARAVLSRDGTHLATTRWDHTVRVWDLATGGLVTLEGPANSIARGVLFSPDGERLVCTYRPDGDAPLKDSPRSMRIWDLDKREAVTIDRVPYGMAAGSFTPDGRLLATVDPFDVRADPLVKVWDAATGHEVFSCRYTDGQVVWNVAFSPDGKRLAACGNKGIRIWGVANREAQATGPSQSRFIDCLAFSPDGKLLATGGAEGIVELWDTATGQTFQTFRGHLGSVETLAFGPDGTRLATGGVDGTLRLWDTTARRDAFSIARDALSAVELPVLSPDGQTLLTGFFFGERRPLRLWDTSTGEPRGGPIELPKPMLHPAWTADSNRLYIADSGKTIHVVDVAAGKVVRTFPVDAVPEVTSGTTFSAIALSPDERWYAHGAPDGTIRLRDARTGVESCTIGKLVGEPGVLAFSPDGSRLLGGDEGGLLKIWDIATGREIAATTLTGVLIRDVQFSPDGKRLAIGGLFGQLLTGEVRILHAEDAHEIWSLKGHALLVGAVVFSPDGLRLATASGDATVRIWDLGTGQEILKLSEGMGDSINSMGMIRFISDGRRLIGAARDRRIRVWDATPLPE